MKHSEDKIRVLNVLPLGSLGGAENFVLELCRHHDKKRFDVKVCILLSGDTVANKMIQHGIQVFRLNMKNGFDVLRVLPLSVFIRRNHIDIVNIHGQNPLGKLFTVLGCPQLIIHTDHGTTISSPVKRKKRVVLFNRLISPFIHHYIAISKGMVKSLQSRERVPANKISLIYNGVDVQAIKRTKGDRRQILSELDVADGIPILGTVGRLCQEKQYHLLIRSLAELKSQKLNFVTLIIGDGPLKEEIRRIIENTGLKKHVKLLGNRDDVLKLLDVVDIFIFASGGEAFSITILEAMAKSKPLVAFDVDGVNEAIENETTGFLVPFKDLEGFAQKIAILIRDPAVAIKMGQAGHQRVQTHFYLSRNIRKLETIYLNKLRRRDNNLDAIPSDISLRC